MCLHLQGTKTVHHIPQGRDCDCLLHYSLFAQISNKVSVLRIQIKYLSCLIAKVRKTYADKTEVIVTNFKVSHFLIVL